MWIGYAEKLGFLFLETSAKNSTNVEQAFMTGGWDEESDGTFVSPFWRRWLNSYWWLFQSGGTTVEIWMLLTILREHLASNHQKLIRSKFLLDLGISWFSKKYLFANGCFRHVIEPIYTINKFFTLPIFFLPTYLLYLSFIIRKRYRVTMSFI